MLNPINSEKSKLEKTVDNNVNLENFVQLEDFSISEVKENEISFENLKDINSAEVDESTHNEIIEVQKNQKVFKLVKYQIISKVLISLSFLQFKT